MPGNSQYSVILQSTKFWSNVKDGNFLPKFSQEENALLIPPLVIGDSAFPFENWLMKPFTNAVLTPPQRYFNYRFSRARMVIRPVHHRSNNRYSVI